jgi:hypothetical protein
MKCPMIAIENANRDLPLTKEYVQGSIYRGGRGGGKLLPQNTQLPPQKKREGREKKREKEREREREGGRGGDQGTYTIWVI